MFAGFPEETIRFFLDLRYHNDLTWFHAHHDEYEKYVREPFRDFVEAMTPTCQTISQDIETRPSRCIARINRDIRFSKDKSPYRDHLWILFRRANEERDGAAMYWFELSPEQINWGVGFWDCSRDSMDCLRNWMCCQPSKILTALEACGFPDDRFIMESHTAYKRMKIPDTVPESLHSMYAMKDPAIIRCGISVRDAYSPDLIGMVSSDFMRLRPIYNIFREAADNGRTERR